MTDALTHHVPPTAGKHNMATAAFAELRAARREGHTPEGEGLSFNDLIDTLNPLQHIPVISEIYRGLTGDRISPQARIAGGTLYGGPIGLAATLASMAIAGGNGERGVGDRLYASLFTPEDAASDTALRTVSTDDGAGAAVLAAARANAKAEETASIVAENPAPVSVAAAAGMPQLSPEAFAALIGSFDDPAPIEKGLSSIAPQMSLDMEGPVDDEEPAATPADILSAMNQALDKYQALKHAP